MEVDAYNYNSQQSQDGRSRKKKKKDKKAKRNLEEDFTEAQNEITEEYSEVGEIKDDPSPSKKKSSKKKRSRATESPVPEENVQNHVQIVDENQSKGKKGKLPVPGPTTPSKSPKKGAPAPSTTASTAAPPKVEVDFAEGINIIASMSYDDIDLLLNKVEAECPPGDTKRPSQREATVDWNKIAFSCYGPQQCRSAWVYLMNQTRKYRIMYELVQEVKHNLSTDYHKFMKKNIESAPDFPKQPYATGAFQYFCKEKWEQHKSLQEKLNKKVENFLNFQTKCHQEWGNIGEARQKEYDQKAKLLNAEYKAKVQEFYARYPAFTQRPEKLNKDGKPETKDRPVSDYLRRQVVKMSQEMFKDAPKLPLTPMQLYIQHKLKRTEPTPLPADEPELKNSFISRWKELSGGKKLKWIQKCIKYSERYQEEVTEYKKTHPMFFLPKEFQISKLINKEEFQIWTEHHGQPPLPKNSIYEYFLQEFKKTPEAAELTEEDFSQVGKEKWNNLPAIEKERYKLNFRMYSLNFRSEIEYYINTVPEILRASVIDNLPKKYKKMFLEEVEKQPLVKESDLLEILGDGAPAGKSQKRKPNDGGDGSSQQEDGLTPSKTKKKKKSSGEEDAMPLYAQELGDEHRQMLEEQVQKSREAKRQKKRKDEGGNESYFPGKSISPSIINDAIHGIFDGRQLERRFTVYYYYARYVASEKSWVQLYRTIGIVETAARIIETFNRLSQQQQQVFLDDAYRFHCSLRFYDKPISNGKDLLKLSLRSFPEEPIPPPKSARSLYRKDTILKRTKDPTYQAPPWAELDSATQMCYLKKLYRDTREYILNYERFVRNMTPNDMIEYLVKKSLEWNVGNKEEMRHYSDSFVYATADSAHSQIARKTYALEVSDDGEESEPEIFSAEDGSLHSDRLGLAGHNFRYTSNPFSRQKQGSAGQPSTSLMERLCSDYSNDLNDSDNPSSTSDEDEREYGHLVRSEKEKRKDKKFRQELRKIERYYFPLSNCYESLNFDQVLEMGHELEVDQREEQNWAYVRSLINSKRKFKEDQLSKNKKKEPIGRNKKAPKPKTIARTKRGRKILPRKSKSPAKPQRLPEEPAAQAVQERIPTSPTKSLLNIQEQLDSSESDDDEASDIIPSSTTRFIQTAVNRPEFSEQQNVTDSVENSPSRKPGLILVPHSPKLKPPTWYPSQGKENRKASRTLDTFSAASSSSAEPVVLQPDASWSQLTTTMTLAPSIDSDDEFRVIDSLGGDRGIFSESELNQFDDLLM